MKILVPVDGSDNSLRVTEYATKLVESHEANEITLLTVACYSEPMAVSETYNTFRPQGDACIIASTANSNAAKQIFEEKNLPVKTEVIAGDPAEVILDYVEKHGIERIIMGSRGLSSLKGMLLGSVSHKVLNLAKIPVTIVK